MKATSPHRSLPLRGFLAAALATLLTIANVSATVRYYQATWSGGAFGNGASATATAGIDDALLANPGDNANLFGSGPLVSFSIQVSGSGAGDGFWTTPDFSAYYLTMSDPLVLGVNWVGQPQPATNSNWGQNEGSSQDFNVFLSTAGTAAGAPSGSQPFVLSTSNGVHMVLTSFAPLYDLHTGLPISNVSGTTVKTLYPSMAGPDGTLYAKAKIAGMGVTTANDDVLLRHIGVLNAAEVLAREGSSLAGEQLVKLGDPLLESTSGRLYFLGGLLQNGTTVTKLNDSVLVACSTNGGGLSLVAREGQNPPKVATRVFTKFAWLHPTRDGLFFGATATDAALNPKAVAGVWFWDGSHVLPVVVPGDNITLDGNPRVVKSISAPTAASPVNYNTRVGDASSVSLLIKTVTGETILKHFEQPFSVE
jgi:hypothetical protein